jgi:hypothetical protein
MAPGRGVLYSLFSSSLSQENRMHTRETMIQQAPSFKTFSCGAVTPHRGDCRDVLKEVPESSAATATSADK